jgi:Ca2+-binding EF-hand superfamily protein
MKRLLLTLTLVTLTACATNPVHHAMTRSERAARADELFAQFDINGDGYITQDELRGGIRYLAKGDGMGESGVMMGLNKQKKKTIQKRFPREISNEEINRAVKDAFSGKDAGLGERLSQEEFRKVIVERQRGPGDADPWEPMM